MAAIKKAINKQSAKEMKRQLEQQIGDALIHWKDNLGEKKFDRRVKKAAKAFAKKLKLPSAKKQRTVKSKRPQKEIAM